MSEWEAAGEQAIVTAWHLIEDVRDRKGGGDG